MQTQNEPIPDTERPDLDAEIAKAEKQLAKLEKAAEQAKTEAERAQTAFEKEPTAQAHTDAAVAKQKAANAKRAAFMFSEGTLKPLQHARQVNLDEAERAELRQIFHHGRLTEQQQRMQAALETMAREMDDAAKMLSEILVERHEKMPRAITIGAVGDREKEITLESLVNDVSARVADAFRDQMIEPHMTHAKLIVGGTGNALANLYLQITRPLYDSPSYIIK